ncbi:PAS domain-containing sensor histidine kinase [Rufibacter latericius]|uniref:Oxygen sensor histidine kinase NreB n=1 Tax=Rufibacter latericius TaxID=2487040 RepID=A0A3M9M8E9_9BACT|nr:PAS domain S-box protein [Rufibacter latericius]RNI21831.1 PAS domain S-box protein [Rufibacter latericius]
MSDEKSSPIGMAHDFSLLRQRAEKLQKPVSVTDVQKMTPHEVRLLIQELQIHQTELEMQNHQLQLATQELEIARAKYLDLYQHSPFGYVTLDEHGVIEEANAKGVELLASTKKELIARRFSQFVHTESLDAFYGFFKRVLLSDRTQTVELQVVSHEGTVFYAQLEGMLLRRENDTDQCRIAFIDVTERKTAHLELVSKEALLSTIINSSLNAIQVFRAVRDSNGTLIDFEWVLLNRTAELFLDHTLEQLRRHRLTELLPSFLTDGHFFTFVHVVENGQPATFTAHFIENKTERWLNCVAVKLDDGFVLTFEDVTQQRIANEKLQESQLLIKKTAEAMPDFLYVEDLILGRNVYNNRDFLAFLGYTPADIKGHPRELLDTLYHPEDAHLLQDRANRFSEVKDGHFLKSQVRIKAKDGTWRDILFRETIFKRGTSGRPIQLVGIAQDITQRLRSEQELLQLHETVTAILHNLPVTLWRVGKDGRVLESKGAHLTPHRQHDHASLIGNTFAAVLPELDRQIRKALEGHKITSQIRFEVDGEEVHKQVYLFQDPQTSEAIGFCLDITEQKQAEAMAQHQKMLLDQLLEHLPLILTMVDQLGTILESKGKGLRKIGKEDDELTGKNFFETFPALKDFLADVLKGHPDTVTVPFVHQGREVYLRHYGFFDQQSKSAISFAFDVTNLKEAQNQLMLEKEFSENLLETHLHGIMAINQDLQINVWNRAIEQITSINRKQVIGEPIFSILPIRAKSKLQKRLSQVLNGEQVTLTNLPFLPQERSFEITLSPLYNAAREVTGILGFVRDTTTQKERQKEETQNRLTQQKAVMDAILTTQNEERKRIAEALHNSLAQLLYAAKLNLEELESVDLGEEKQRLKKVTGFLEEAIKETRTLAHELIPRALVDFGLKYALRDMATRLSTPAFCVQCVITGFDRPTDYGLETHLFRFVQELLNNVMKHAEATEALVQVVDKGSAVRVRVQDNGKGMPQTWSEKMVSKGMGITTIRNRVKLLQGTISIDSAPGEGTCITIDIPH